MATKHDHTQMIKDLAKRNRGQMTFAEYMRIADAVVAVAPMPMLVFGTGRDSDVWRLLSQDNAVFFEDDRRWAKGQRDCTIVKYRTKVLQFELQQHDSITELMAPMEAIEMALTTEWGVIVVDGPKGYRPELPGRLAPIRLASSSTFKHLFVHDCHRQLEQEMCDTMLKGVPFDTVHHLRHYTCE